MENSINNTINQFNKDATNLRKCNAVVSKVSLDNQEKKNRKWNCKN